MVNMERLMSQSIQTCGDLTVGTRNGHVSINGNVKSVNINGVSVEDIPKKPDGFVAFLVLSIPFVFGLICGQMI